MTVLHGNCILRMAAMPAQSVDFILTDPPYLVSYRGRDGRTVANDDNDAWLKPAFAQMYRVLKPDAFCVSFYGWNHADRFLAAWREAGFLPAEEFVFPKRYSSSARFAQRRHEKAMLLVKGRPPPPASPLPDVIEGWRYTGNRLHPTQKPTSILEPIIRCFTKPGDLVLDPFCGSGTTLAVAKKFGRRYIGIDLDFQHVRTATERLARINAVTASVDKARVTAALYNGPAPSGLRVSRHRAEASAQADGTAR